MRHRAKKIKIGSRDAAHRKAMMRNLLTSLVLYEKLKTTNKKAKALQREFDKMMTSVRKQNEMNQVRLMKKVFFTEAPGKKVREVLLERFKDRKSGLTRIKKIGHRVGDDAPVVQIELVS